MERKAIFTEAMHKSAAPAPHALQVGDVIYISGKIGFTQECKLPEGGLAEEVHQAMKNFENTLKAADCTFDNGKAYAAYVMQPVRLSGVFSLLKSLKIIFSGQNDRYGPKYGRFRCRK